MNDGTQRRAGELDPDFGVGGLVEVTHSITGWLLRSLTVCGLADGRIACAGTLNAFRSVAFRLEENGRLDRQFGRLGFCELPMNPEVRFGQGFRPRAVHACTDGSMLILGQIHVLVDDTAAYVPAAARVSSDGHLDPSFGDQGLAIYVPPPFVAEGLARNATGALVARTGKTTMRQCADGASIFIADVDLPSGTGALVVKILRDGALDASFGNGGFVTPRIPLSGGLDIDRLGRIVVSGSANQHGYLMRYLPEGQEDATFGTAGFAWLPPPEGTSSLTAMDLRALDDGRLFALALLQEHGVWPALGKTTGGVFRLTVNGQVDGEFNDGQPAIVDLLPDGYSPDSLDIDAAGRLLVAGRHVSVRYDSGGIPIATLTFAASRQFATGALDPDFGDGGKVRLTFLQMPQAVYVSGARLVFVTRTQREGRIVVGRLLG